MFDVLQWAEQDQSLLKITNLCVSYFYAVIQLTKYLINLVFILLKPRKRFIYKQF